MAVLLAGFVFYGQPAVAQSQDLDWNAGPSLPAPRWHTFSVALDGEIYVIGGFEAAGIDLPGLMTNLAFSPATGLWSEKAGIPDVSRDAMVTGAATAGGKIYAVVGYRTTSRLYEYAPEFDKWERKADVPTIRYGLQFVGAAGSLFAIGGIGEDGAPVQVVERYDVPTDTWSSVSSPIVEVGSGARSAVVGDNIYVFGGSHQGSAAQAYDPVLDAWTLLPVQMPVESVTSAMGAVASGSQIYLLGYGAQVFEFDTVTSTFASVADLPVHIVGAGLASMNGKIYTFGGGVPVSYYYESTNQVWVATLKPHYQVAAPTGMTASPAGPRAIRLTWQDNSSDESNFVVSDGTDERLVAANRTAYVWNKIDPGSSMCFEVRALNDRGVSDWTLDQACVTTPLVGPPR
jgi:N-acetylneuraminic acid mutarotase